MKQIFKLNCFTCKKDFTRTSRDFTKDGKYHFCSRPCFYKSDIRRVIKPCKNCEKIVSRTLSQSKKVKNIFCSKSCAAIYNNKHKKIGTRRSKLETWIESRIKEHYPTIECLYNSKKLGFELDFYFPTLRLGIEINGIVHYEPIYGEKKFERIRQNDSQKLLACAEQGIELIVIPTLEGYLRKDVLEKYWVKTNEIILAASVRI